MIDVSYNIPRLPGPDEPLDYERANAIEWNLYALIRAWPVFESAQILPAIGSYGFLQLDETASPVEGVETTFIQYLPRLLVFLAGDGLEHVSWRGEGWKEETPGVLVYGLTEVSAPNANAALRQLWLSADGDADVTVTLAGENLAWKPDGLRLVGLGWTLLRFRSRATWDLAKALKKTWDGARPLTWDEAAALRKDGTHETK